MGVKWSPSLCEGRSRPRSASHFMGMHMWRPKGAARPFVRPYTSYVVYDEVEVDERVAAEAVRWPAMSPVKEERNSSKERGNGITSPRTQNGMSGG